MAGNSKNCPTVHLSQEISRMHGKLSNFLTKLLQSLYNIHPNIIHWFGVRMEGQIYFNYLYIACWSLQPLVEGVTMIYKIIYYVLHTYAHITHIAPTTNPYN